MSLFTLKVPEKFLGDSKMNAQDIRKGLETLAVQRLARFVVTTVLCLIFLGMYGW